MERMFCEQCNEWIIPLEGVTSITSRGYQWCAKHANIFFVNGKPIVNYPSSGKLIPKTIMTEE